MISLLEGINAQHYHNLIINYFYSFNIKYAQTLVMQLMIMFREEEFSCQVVAYGQKYIFLTYFFVL